MARRRRVTKEYLDRLAKRLEENLPKSEVWFRSIYERHGLKLESDKYNQPWFKRIPDIVNHDLKYVIEIDGSIHEKKEQIARDRKKDRFYENKNYRVFRVKAYDNESLDFNIESLCSYREAFYKPPSQPRVILKRLRLLESIKN